MKRLDRLVSMALAFAARRRVRGADLAKQFAVSERTVYRDVQALQQAGFPVVGNAGDGYRVVGDAFLRPLALTEDEAGALVTATLLLGAPSDAELRGHLLSATAKIESILGPEARARVKRQRDEVYVAPSAARPVGPLGELLKAVDDRELLRIEYDAVGDKGSTERAIEPLGLVRIGEAWLLAAYCRLREDTRAFRIDRIRRIHHLRERYLPRPEHSFAELLAREGKRYAGS